MRPQSASSFICFLSELNRKVVCLTWNSCSLTKFLSLVLCTRWDVLLYLVCIWGLLFLFLSYFFVFSFGHFSNWYWWCQRLRARILVALACRWPWKIRCCTQWLKKKRKKQNTGTQGTIFWKQGFERQLINLFFLIDSCSKIGEEQSSEDAEDGPPELLVSSKSHAPVIAVHLLQLGWNILAAVVLIKCTVEPSTVEKISSSPDMVCDWRTKQQMV